MNSMPIPSVATTSRVYSGHAGRKKVWHLEVAAVRFRALSRGEESGEGIDQSAWPPACPGWGRATVGLPRKLSSYGTLVRRKKRILSPHLAATYPTQPDVQSWWWCHNAVWSLWWAGVQWWLARPNSLPQWAKRPLLQTLMLTVT
jgi:hypothetical protein